MGKEFIKKLSVFLVLILCMNLGAGCGGTAEQAKQEVREKLLLAYQYLENMEFDAALDTFAAVIEVDEKQVDAYIGMARAYSARGEHAKAGETVRKGREATENHDLDTLEQMYDRISQKEDRLRELADLIRRSQEGIPGQLEEQESHLFSELLEELWQSLDMEDTWPVYDGTDYVIVYPVDPENGQYLLVYPDGHFYLGSIGFTPYSELIALTEGEEAESAEEGTSPDDFDREPLIVPDMEGLGTLAGVSERNGLADFYIGQWKDGLAEGEGIFVFQQLPDGARYVWYGTFKAGAYDAAQAFYGSSDLFLMRALGKETEEADLLAELNAGLLGLQGKDGLMEPAIHGEDRYTGAFANMDLFGMLDRGEDERVSMELLKRDNNSRSPFHTEGDILYLGQGWGVYDYDREHDLYVVSPDAKEGGPGLYLREEANGSEDKGDVAYYVTDRYGKILTRSAGVIWFTNTGYRAMSYKDPDTGEEYWGSLDNEMIDANRYDLWQTDYDWEGNQISTSSRYGGLNSIYDIYLTAYNPEIRRAIDNGHAGPDADITLEKAGDQYLVLDRQGNQIGSIQAGSNANWDWAVNGNMISVFNMELWYGCLYCVMN